MLKYVLILLVFSSQAQALTKSQVKILSMAYTEGKRIGYPETIQAIIFLESSAGENKQNLNDPSYGVGHMKVATFKNLLKRHFNHSGFSDDEIPGVLKKNDRFAIYLTCLYFKSSVNFFRKRYKTKVWSRSVLSYNCGVTGVHENGLSNDPNDYVRKINSIIKNVIRPLNKELKGGEQCGSLKNTEYGYQNSHV